MTDDSTNRTTRIWLVAVAAQSLVAVVVLTHPTAVGYSPKLDPFGDVQIYFSDAWAIVDGKVPYRDFPVEYPILAIPLFLAPLLAGTDFESYRWAFVLEMLLINALAIGLVIDQIARSSGSRFVLRGIAWYSAFFVALSPTIVVRFDLAPMLLAFAGAVWMARGRMALGGIAVGLGVLVKLVPGLVVLPFLVSPLPWKARLRTVGALGATLGLGALLWWSWAGDRMVGMVRYHRERGIEIESLYSSAYLLAYKFAGVFIINHFDHGSMNIMASGAHDAATLSVFVQGALWLLIVGRVGAAGPGQELRFATAALLAFVIAGKVLSPQYLIWLIPFLCVIKGRDGTMARSIFLAACVLTSWIFPGLFYRLIQFDTLPIVVLVARNLLLVALFAVVLGPRPVIPTRSFRAACS